MDDLGLTPDEWRRVLDACRWVQVGDAAPDYLREFLARRLEEASQDALADRVRQFQDGQLGALWHEVRRRQGV